MIKGFHCDFYHEPAIEQRTIAGAIDRKGDQLRPVSVINVARIRDIPPIKMFSDSFHEVDY